MTDDQAQQEQNWEQLCHQCGECCFEKSFDKKGRVITTRIPCRFLDIHSRQCRVYPRRFELEDDCIKLTPENIKQFDWLPEGCGYRRLLGGG